MCYKDGGPQWRKMLRCAWPGARYRLDCGDDDYFAVDPRPRSWLAGHPSANVANSFPRGGRPQDPSLRTVRAHLVVRDEFRPHLAGSPARATTSVLWMDGSVKWLAQDFSGSALALDGLDAQTRFSCVR